MYEGCFLQTRLSKALNVSVDQMTRPRIYFKTCGRAFERLSRAFETLGQAFETLDHTRPCVCIKTRSILSQKPFLYQMLISSVVTSQEDNLEHNNPF